MQKDLIARDISRCSDERCPTSSLCERYLQRRIDRQKGEMSVAITDFRGREKIGLCEHFLNVAISE